jgi:hypothetical protein
MAFEINESLKLENPVESVFEAALGAIEGLEGKVESQDAAAGAITVFFNKRILGQTLGDRTRMIVSMAAEGDGTKVDIEIFPLDAIGQKLKFGARKGVSRKVLSWFIAHLQHRLK